MTERRFILCSAPGDFASLLTRRMRDHRRWQHREAERMCAEIFDEVGSALTAHTISAKERSGVLPFPEAKPVREKRVLQ